jgi:hypothetical protein
MPRFGSSGEIIVPQNRAVNVGRDAIARSDRHGALTPATGERCGSFGGA